MKCPDKALKLTVPARGIALLSGLLLMPCIAGAPLSVTISQSSIRINGVELRSAPKGEGGRYISLAAAEKVLGKPQDTYVAGLGVRVYAWRNAGIHMQRGFRASDNGKIFKFQVWFVDTYDKDKDKHSGKFSGHVQLDGLDITPNTTFDSIRGQLEKAGFEITDDQNIISAKKGDITIFTVETTNNIERIEAWCS
jgi:hypothetical protein